MVDQNSQFYAILTNVGAAKQANADALGIPWKITQLGVGDANGLDPTPNASQISLINEWRRAPLNQLKVDDKDSSIIVAEQVIPAEVGGRWIREIALYDSDGDMVAVANCPPTYKPLLNQGSGRTQVVRMNLVVSSSSNVELKIDPSVVLATREWVTGELAKQDFKHSVLAATTANIALTGLQTIDGIALTAGARVLVKNQTAAKDNGLYTVAAGAWARSADADISAEVTPGLLVLVERGTVNGDSAWQLVTDAPITLGTTALVFEMAFGRTGIAEGTYRSVTVDKCGRVVAATNPTTVADYGLTDVYTKTQLDQALTGKVNSADKASQATSEAGADNNKWMTALGVTQAVIKRLTEVGLGGKTAPPLGDFKLNNSAGIYHASAGGAASPTPNGPPSPYNNIMGVLVMTPRADATYYLAVENSPTSRTRRLWLGQYSGITNEIYWSSAITSDQIASQPEVDAGVLDDLVVTPKKMRWGFAYSFSSNGYLMLPTWLLGFTIQWGTVAGVQGQRNITFPIEFPGSILQLMLTSQASQTISADYSNQWVNTVSKSGSAIYVDGTQTIRWLALGR